jgi:hypothetical protein
MAGRGSNEIGSLKKAEQEAAKIISEARDGELHFLCHFSAAVAIAARVARVSCCVHVMRGTVHSI